MFDSIENYINLLHKRMLKGKLSKAKYKKMVTLLILWDINNSDYDWEGDEDDY